MIIKLSFSNDINNNDTYELEITTKNVETHKLLTNSPKAWLRLINSIRESLLTSKTLEEFNENETYFNQDN